MPIMAEKKPQPKPKKSAKPEAPAVEAAIGKGKSAPAFELNDQAGKTHKLSDYKGRWVVLYFYPKDDTPGCTTEACQFRDNSAEFAKRNAVVLGVSPDNEKSHAKFATKFQLPFPLLADTEKKTVEAYGVWKEKSMYGRKYMGVERTTYLIGPDGKVAKAWAKLSVTGHDADVLKAIDEA
jgi:thioredoxin-dependent peroxiredoxin